MSDADKLMKWCYDILNIHRHYDAVTDIYMYIYEMPLAY